MAAKHPIATHRDRLQMLDAAALCDAARAAKLPIGVVDPAIRLMSRGANLIGSARLVMCDLDILDVWHALSEAQAGEAVLIACTENRAVVGELFSAEAARRNLAGIVIDGYCRDTARLSQQTMPVYARGSVPQAGSTNVARGPLATMMFGGVIVSDGDLVFGDGDGVVIIPISIASDLIPIAEEIQRVEAAILRTVEQGGSIFDHTNLTDHYRRRLNGQPSELKVTEIPGS